MSNLMDFLNTQTTSSSPSVSFPNVGDTVLGTITDAAIRKSENFNTKEMEDKMVITVRTEVDTKVSDGDGGYTTVNGEEVAVWVKVGAMATALKKAVQAAGASTIEEGARIQVTYTGLGEKGKKGFAPKLYSVEYERPAGGVSVASL